MTTVTFGKIEGIAAVPDYTTPTTDREALTREITQHALPHLAEVLAAVGRPELADAFFYPNADLTGGCFLHISFARDAAARFCGVRITTAEHHAQRPPRPTQTPEADWTDTPAIAVGDRYDCRHGGDSVTVARLWPLDNGHRAVDFKYDDGGASALPLESFYRAYRPEAAPDAEAAHVVADDSDDPEHVDDCPGCPAASDTHARRRHGQRDHRPAHADRMSDDELRAAGGDRGEGEA